MHKKNRNKSSEKAVDEKLKHQYERKCHTPSGYQPKKKGKSKQKSTQKKSNHNSIKQMKVPEANMNLGIPKKQSPFKHKHRPISNLTNVRHAKNIQHQLSNLNESAFRNQSSYLQDSQKKVRYDPNIQKFIDEGKKFMKNNNYDKSMKIFRECLQKDPQNIEAQYLYGLSCYHLEIYDEVIKTLVSVLIKDDHYRKNVYLFLAISEKKTGNPQDAILTLTKAIAFYPKYYDALILRAKILSKQKRYYDAVEDLNKCIKIQPQNIQAYITKADCLRSLTQYREAINLYSEILKSKLDLQILLKRSIAYIDNGNISEALEDLNLIITKSHNNSQAFLFKGQAYSKINNYNEAILSYEQSIKFNTSKRATTKALYEITKLKIDIGDYYGASYTLERANSLQVQPKVLDKMKIFTDGGTAIMKKKYKKGIQNLSILAKKQNLSDQLRPLLYSFRSYGYFCQHKYSNAINDLNNLVKLGYNLDKACSYNYSLLEGIIACQNNQFMEAEQKFDEATNKRKDFVDPQIYKCLTKICEYNRVPKNRNISLLEEALLLITSTLQRDDNANSYYLSACILYEMNEFEQAFQYIEKAIDKAQDHSMKYLYLKAMIQGMLGQYKQAYKGFYNVLSVLSTLKEKDNVDPDQPQVQKQIPETYLNRAKCYLLFGEKKKAFQDLQTYIGKKPLDSQVHSVAGQLLFSIGAFEDAVKAYNYSPNIQKHKKTLLERLKCYLLLKELNFCLKDMEKIVDLGEVQIKYDYHCLDSLKEASKGQQNNFKSALKKIEEAETCLSKGQQGIIFHQSDLLFYKGFFHFQLQNYEQALKLFLKSKTLKTLNNQLKVLQDVEDYDEQFDNCILTNKEMDYNIAITQLMLEKDETAFQVLTQYQQFKAYLENNIEEMSDITPFPISNRLCSIFPQTNYKNKIKFRLSFCLPEVQSPEIKFEIDQKIIRDLSMSSTQSRPDAPWIKRNSHGVIFTDEIVGFDVDLKTQKSLGAIKIETEYQENEKKSKIRELLTLDSKVEERLAKLIEKNKN